MLYVRDQESLGRWAVLLNLFFIKSDSKILFGGKYGSVWLEKYAQKRS